YVTIKSYLPYCQIVYPTPLTATNYFTVLQTDASVLLAGTAHCNEKDTWIVTHTPGTLNSFLLSASGVSNTPVVSPVAATLLPEEHLQVGNSNLKFSANGEKMVVALTEENKIVVFEFNNLTGKFSNSIKLSIPPDHLLEDVELSPDGSKLYIGSYQAMDDYELHYISQMDLDAGNVTQIEQSIVWLTTFPDRVACIRSCFLLKRTMQLAPDGKIYVGMREGVGINLDLTLSVITHPNNKGLDVLYKRNAQNVNKQYKFLNYNYIRSGSFSLKENGIQVQKMVCSDRPAIFSLLYKNNIDSVKWDFGDPSSGNNNYSTNPEPQHRYPAPGTYGVKAIIYRNCLIDTARKTITVQEDIAVRVTALIKDTVVCTGGELLLDATAPFAIAYTWENGLIYPQRTIDKSGHYEITIMNDCSSDKKDFDVLFKDCECRVFTPTAFTPNNDGLNDIFRPVVKCLAKQYQLKIFSRYGDVIFQSSVPGKGWDGKIKNTTAPSGVYAWILQYRNPNNKELITENGVI
ncbi:MAG TPA: gliding motility-associated C-terminal domain-containing protein, partial [Nitrososphaeraceae archaeon]|nr:gliding motility-associated C-terminal domain-containing protein [Nitrososphaeraceae archaeon]